MVNCELSPKSLLRLLLLSYIRAIDAYIFWSLSLSPFSNSFCDTWLLLSLKRTCFRHLLLSVGGFGHSESRWYSYLHLIHSLGVRSVRRLFKSLAAQAFYLSFLILLKHFSIEWLAPTEKCICFWTIFSLWLFLLERDLLSRFK